MKTLSEIRKREMDEFTRIMGDTSLPMMERVKKFEIIKRELDMFYNITNAEIDKLQQIVDNKQNSFATRKLALNTIYELEGIENCKF